MKREMQMARFEDRRLLLKAGIGALAGAVLAGETRAQSYPNKPVKLIVPFPAGGNFDVVSRTYATPLSEAIGQSIVVENRGGAAGAIGTAAAARSEPDGYTLVVGDIATTCINRFAQAGLQYDPIKDFTPVSLLATVSVVLTARTDFPAATFAEFLAAVRANPGKFKCGTGGTGSLGHLALELLKSMAKLDILHVPYRGGAPAATDLMGGQIDLVLDGAAFSFAKAGRIKALAVTGDRIPAMPDVPTIAESGVPGFRMENFWGLLAPAGTPQPVIERLNAEVARIAQNPAIQKQLGEGGLNVRSSSPQQLAALIQSSTDKIGTIVKDANIKFNE